MRFALCLLLIFSLVGVRAPEAAELNPGYPENIHTDGKEAESPLRRGEIIFFISYPFTFLASFAGYGLMAYGLSAADGKSGYTPDGAFYGLTAVTAAILSFGIAMDDHLAVKAQSKSNEGNPTGYLSLSFRF
ncbi:MAG: hypothetical protein KF713_12945 [Turneriella sp.]|nr:hypothetical protein [Turneriella sp.]